jgi:hypothetical protein
MNGTEDLSIYIKADGAPQAASAVGDVGAARFEVCRIVRGRRRRRHGHRRLCR